MRTIAAIAGLFVLSFLLERLVPLRKSTHLLLGRLLVNLCISALALLTALWTVRPVVSSLLNWTSEKPFGLIHLAPLPAAARFILAFLLLDLSFYYWHLANHRVPFLWRFHNVHHIDPDLDVSTAFRFHFGEVAFSAGFRVVQITLIGVPVWAYLAYELVFQVNTLFQHSNVRLPIHFERWLNKVFVTPRMHGIHHSQVKGETNSNYSVVFSWWDRLHRTLGLHVPQSQLTIGIAGYSAPEDNRLWNALTMPFRKQRDYWRRPDGASVERDSSTLGSDRHRLTE